MSEEKQCCPNIYNARDRYRFFFQKAPSLNAIINSDGSILEINDTLTEVLGYTNDDLAGMSVLDLIVAEQKDHIVKRLDRLFGGDTTGEEIVDVIDKHGSVRTLYFPDTGTRLFAESDGTSSVLLTMIDITERKKTEDALRTRTERFSDIFHGVDIGLVVVDRVGRVLEVNNRFLEMTGLPLDEVLRHSAAGIVLKYLRGKNALKIAGDIGRMLMGHSVAESEFEFNSRIFTLSTPSIRWSTSTFTGILRDVTAEKQLEQMLKIQRDLAGTLSATSRAENAFSLIIDHVLRLYDVDSCGIYIFDDELNQFVLKASRGFGGTFVKQCARHGENTPQYQLAMKKQIIFGHFSTIVKFMSDDCRREGLRAVAAVPIIHEEKVIASLNLASHVVDEFKPVIRDAIEVIAGQLGGVLVRVSAESRLRESEERFRAVFENAEEVVFIKDTNYAFSHVNPAFTRLFKKSASEIIGKTDTDLFTAEEAEQLRRVDTAVLGGDVLEYEDSIIVRGEPKTFLTVKVPLKDSSGRINGLCGFARDITMRKGVEDELKKSRARDKAALAEKEVLLREIHHRVKNNLQVISSLLSLQRDGISDECHRQMFTDSVNRIRSMGAIHELLYKSDNLGYIDPGDYLSDIVESLAGVYAVSASNVEYHIEVDAPPLDIDHAIPCGLIVNELVSNAFKHAFPDGMNGIISLGMNSRDNNTIILEVRDNGVGVPDDFDWMTTDSLGLKIVRLLTEHQLQGTIEFESVDGTVFRIVYDHDF